MSWHCSLALVADFSRLGCLDGVRSALLRSTRIAERSCFGAKKRATLSPSPSGTTCERLMLQPGVDAWMLCLPGSPASPSARRARSSELMTSATYGPRHIVSSKKSIPDTSCSKMCSGFVATCPWSSETCEGLATPSKGPSWLPPPQWARDISDAASGYAPTATVHGEYNRRGLSKKSGTGLATALKRFVPTTKAVDSGPDYTRATRPNAGGDDLVTVLHKSAKQCSAASIKGCRTGTPNPDWRDWFVGLPIGWSALERLATSRFQQWLRQHGGC